MLRALVYTDLQATEGHERCYCQPTLPLQRLRVQRFFQQLLSYYHSLQCNAIIDLGDTTDDRAAIPIPTIDALQRGLAPFRVSRDLNIKLIGNHEQFTRAAQIDSSELYSPIFSVTRGVEVYELDLVTIVAASYPADGGSFVNALNAAIEEARRAAKPLVVLGHFDVLSAKLSNGTDLTNGVPLSVLEPADLVLLGHIHLPQTLRHKVHYVGSPFQQDFGESGEKKRLGLLTVGGNGVKLQWVPLTGFPEYHQRVSWPEFKAHFRPDSEDRWRVELKSPEETEELLKHPFYHRVLYDYAYMVAEAGPNGLPNHTPQLDWGLEAAMKRWTQEVPPQTRGISGSPEDLYQFGLQLLQAPE